MATAKLTYPFKAIHGQLKASDRFYCRMLYGRCILQRKPRRSTPRQRAMRRAFALRYQGAHHPLPTTPLPHYPLPTTPLPTTPLPTTHYPLNDSFPVAPP